ncbi:MAG TPA: hypothetical protein DCZ94_07525 [Lentisphaeria bacterium]|nr:MAG: hypothetical protein A2X48_14200 [Lentisphaerae bacterium GWF2_49_21]HBC86786.1 hypothetical protein [Lentisphaeria bacterium]
MNEGISQYIGYGLFLGAIILAYLTSSLITKKLKVIIDNKPTTVQSATLKYKLTLWTCRLLPPICLLIFIEFKILDALKNPFADVLSIFFMLSFFPYLALTCFFIPALYLVLNDKYSDFKYIIYAYCFGLFTWGIAPTVYYWIKIDKILENMIRSQGRIPPVPYGLGEDIKTPPYDYLPVLKEEIDLINHWRFQGVNYISSYISKPDNPPSLTNLDEAFLLWRNQSSDSKPNVNDFTNGLSILFADCFFAETDCQWVLVDVQLETHLAVFHKKSGCSVNVRDIFAKRIQNTEPWIKSLFHAISKDINSKIQQSR